MEPEAYNQKYNHIYVWTAVYNDNVIYLVDPPGYAPPGYPQQQAGYAPPQPQPGYAPPQQGYAPPQQGYAPVQQVHAPPQQAYAPQPGYAPQPQQGYPPQPGYGQTAQPMNIINNTNVVGQQTPQTNVVVGKLYNQIFI